MRMLYILFSFSFTQQFPKSPMLFLVPLIRLLHIYLSTLEASHVRACMNAQMFTSYIFILRTHCTHSCSFIYYYVEDLIYIMQMHQTVLAKCDFYSGFLIWILDTRFSILDCKLYIAFKCLRSILIKIIKRLKSGMLSKF